jgi:1,4-dihydroxy-2-naphthoate octaprenyltransferase
MNKPNRFGIWMQQIRGPFLILAVVLTLIGVAAARHDGHTHWIHAALLLAGVLLTHIAVNLFNELSDYHTGIDRVTQRTPFSGGSGMMQAGHTSPAGVRLAAYGAMFAAAAIGFYFAFATGWLVLLFMAAGGLAIRFYTSHLARWLIGEFVSGLTLGSMVVLGTYYALTGQLTLPVVVLSIPPGLLTFQLLFLNEFPDVEADKQGGRRHLVIQFGHRTSAHIYAAVMVVVYLLVVLAPLLGYMKHTAWMALATLPLAVRAVLLTLKHFDEIRRLVPALGFNVAVVIGTDLLLAVAYFI